MTYAIEMVVFRPEKKTDEVIPLTDMVPEAFDPQVGTRIMLFTPRRVFLVSKAAEHQLTEGHRLVRIFVREML